MTWTRVGLALRRLARLTHRRRFAVLLLWAAVTVVLAPQARRASSRLEAGAHLGEIPAGTVDRDLHQRFRSKFAHRLVLVVGGLPQPSTPAGRSALQEIVAAVQAVPGVAGTMSYLDSGEPLFMGRAGGSFLIVGLNTGDKPAEPLMGPLRAATEALEAKFAPRYPSADLAWTGEIPLDLDIREASSEDARAAEKRALPLALVLLFAAFGSVAAALLPVAVGILAVLLTLGAAALLARTWHLSIFVQNIASMIGLGLGIDYALLVVSRFRESLSRKKTVDGAVEDCVPHVGETLLLSALPVVIGFGALLTMPTSDFRSIGVAGMLVALFTLVLALTLLPSILAAIGTGVDAGHLVRVADLHREHGSARWRRWGTRVVRRPWLSLLLGGAPVVWLALQADRLRTGTVPWFPANPESVRAVLRLEDMGRANVYQALRVLVDLPPGSPADSPEGWAAIRNFARSLEDDPRVERVHSAADGNPRGVTRERLKEMTEDGVISLDGQSALFEVLPALRSRDERQTRLDIEDFARALQATPAQSLTGLAGTRLRVGGLPAANTQFNDANSDRFHSVVFLVLAMTFFSLFLGFRSLLVPIKAVLLNLLTVAAAFGALVLVFQDGHGAGLFGLEAGTQRIFPIVPILAFCIVFGLSMDYEVFLVSRIAEARRSGLAEEPAIVEGLARTGSVITSAASIMIAVFAAFAMGDFLPVQMLGFVLSVAVLLDATLVRTVVGPALLRLAGKWNWWPGERRHRPESELARASEPAVS